MTQKLLPALLLLLWSLLGPAGPAGATTPVPPAGHSLAEALNPDGTLRAGANGSFDARQFRMRTAPDGRPVFRPAGTTGAGDERWADGFELPNGATDIVHAVVRAGNDIYIGGNFTAVGSVAANHVAKWNGTAWSSLGAGIGNGLDGVVSALAVAGNGDLYAGGDFTQAGGLAANYVARWNGTAWSSLGAGIGNGVNGSVYSLAVAGNGAVYAGGSFTQAGGAAADNIAKWNGTAWNSLGAGVGGTFYTVYALAVADSGDVYAGGYFTQAGGLAANCVARWNGTAWSSLGTGAANGTDNTVYALAVASNGDVYAGGKFTQAGGMAANSIAKWNGTAWSSLGAGTRGYVKALAVAGNGDVYAGSDFTNYVAKWNGTAWSSLSAGISGPVNALAVAGNGDLYAGGDFTQAGGLAANYVARWNGTAWSSLGTGIGNGANSSVYSLAVAGNGDVYVGGNFTRVGRVAANYVAKWNGTAWSSLGAGTDGTVYALAVAGNGDVYAGGSFTQAGGMAADNIAKWNGTAWNSLGTGIGTSIINRAYAAVLVLAVASNGNVYAGGVFGRAGGVGANNIAKWDGTAWSSLDYGTDTFGTVYALVVAGNGDVYAGGVFVSAGGAGGVAAKYVAKWNGTAWSSLGSGMSDHVYALAVAGNGDVYAGGKFTQAGGVAANYVAKWNGTAWSNLSAGTNLNGAVYSLTAVGNGDVYVGGDFTQVGGMAATRVAKWSGTAWSQLGTGLNSVVTDLATGPTGKLYAAGNFVATGDDRKAMAHFGIYDPAVPLASTAAKATPAAQLFPNPAHGTATLRLPAGAARLPLLLSDALGRLVRQYPAPAGPEALLDLRGLPAGTYVVRCGALSQRLVVE